MFYVPKPGVLSELFGVSTRSLQRARRILRLSPVLAEAVKNGKLSLNKAERLLLSTHKN